ncbi:MAG: hypothetical protein Mars2KO_17420 [Maribacter sp.]
MTFKGRFTTKTVQNRPFGALKVIDPSFKECLTEKNVKKWNDPSLRKDKPIEKVKKGATFLFP